MPVPPRWTSRSRRSPARPCLAGLAIAGLVAACATASRPTTDGSLTDSPRASTASSAPFTLEAPVSRSAGALRVLVYHDMEGLSGQNDWHTFDFDYPEAYKKGRELLVADVNAVVAGLFAGGATTVHVVDAHGSGNPEPDIQTSALDPRATQVFRDRPFRQYVH